MTTRNDIQAGGRYLVQDENHMSDSGPTMEEVFHGLGRMAARPEVKQQQRSNSKAFRSTKGSAKHLVSMN